MRKFIKQRPSSVDRPGSVGLIGSWQLDINVDTQSIKIENEFYLENDRRINTLLTWDNNAIIIENKLNNAKVKINN